MKELYVYGEEYTLSDEIIDDMRQQHREEILNKERIRSVNGDLLISIIVPCYNVAPYIENCIRSLLQQTYKNIEIIPVDDGSQDNTGSILDLLSQKDTRIKVIHQQNGGVTRARLAGVKSAKGEWIGFVDGDDIIEPDMYEHLLGNAQKFNADISHCGYQMVFPSRVDYYYNTGRLVQQDTRAGLEDLLTGSFVEPGLCNKLYNKKLLHNLLRSEYMDFSIKNNEDLLMNFYLFRESATSIYEDVCPYHYLVRKGSAATSMLNKNKLRDPLRVLEIIRKELLEDSRFQEDSGLRSAVNARIAGRLISLATMKDDSQTELVRPYRIQARRKLRRLLPELLGGNYSNRTKILSFWASAWPWSYEKVHKIYAKVRGTDQKYEVR